MTDLLRGRRAKTRYCDVCRCLTSQLTHCGYPTRAATPTEMMDEAGRLAESGRYTAANIQWIAGRKKQKGRK